MRFSQRVVDLKRAIRGGSGFWSRLTRGHSRGLLKHRIRISEPYVSQRVIWIVINRLLKLLDGFLQPVGSALALEVAPSEIELISLGILCVAPGEFLLITARQP